MTYEKVKGFTGSKKMKMQFVRWWNKRFPVGFAVDAIYLYEPFALGYEQGLRDRAKTVPPALPEITDSSGETVAK